MKKSIDFFTVLSEDGFQKASPWKLIFIAAASLVILIQLGIFLYLLNGNQKLQFAAQQNDQLINGQQVKDLLVENQTVEDYSWFVKRDIHTAQLMQNQVNQTAGFRSALFRVVLGVAPVDVRLQSFSYGDNTVNITCTTSDNAPPAAYTLALVETGLFSDVAYHGFTAVSSDQNGQTKISFSIVCKLKMPEVTENDET